MKRRHKKPSPVTLRLGPLPVGMINKTLGLELDDGEAVVTPSHQVHAAKNHPQDYARCLPHVAAIIANPLYIGDDFKRMREKSNLLPAPQPSARASLSR